MPAVEHGEERPLLAPLRRVIARHEADVGSHPGQSLSVARGERGEDGHRFVSPARSVRDDRVPLAVDAAPERAEMEVGGLAASEIPSGWSYLMSPMSWSRSTGPPSEVLVAGLPAQLRITGSEGPTTQSTLDANHDPVCGHQQGGRR
jgi:hypothetical protein